MAHVGELVVRVDATELSAVIQRAISVLQAPPPAPPSAGTLLATAAVAAGVSRPVSRRSLLGLWWKRGGGK